MSGGTKVFQDYFASTNQGTGSINIGPDIFKYQLERDALANTPYTFTLAIQASSNSSNVVASMAWEEVS